MFCKQDRKLKRKFQADLETAFYKRSDVHFSYNGQKLRNIQHSMGLALDTRFYI